MPKESKDLMSKAIIGSQHDWAALIYNVVEQCKASP